MVEILALILFSLSFLFISFEDKFRINKAAIALAIGGLLWVLVIFTGKSKDLIQLAATTAGNEIFGIVMFLLTSMILVEIMSEHHLFDVIRAKLMSLKIHIKLQFVLLAVFCFFLSAALDNMTVGLVMTQVARQFFKGKNLLIAAAGIIVGANAGGSWSPIGDVTTVLLWLAGKYNTFTIVKEGFFPAVTFLIVSTVLLLLQIQHQEEPEAIAEHQALSRKDQLVVAGSMASFILPVIANNYGLPPYIGLLLGLGLIWIFLHIASPQENVMERIFKRIDLASVNFYIGILLAANALHILGVLESLSKGLFGSNQEFFRVVWGSITAGLAFSVFDNIPLTALSIKLIHLHQESLWVLLALTIGNGGSVLLLGSAAGIAVMSTIPELTFGKFFKIAFLPTLLAYIAMVAVWLAQYFLFLK